MALKSQIDAAARGDSKPPKGRMFRDDWLLAIPDAGEARWATFTVHVIEHARSTDMPREALLELLVAGPDLPARRFADGKVKAHRGRCPACRRSVELSLDGLLHRHQSRPKAGDQCGGSYKTPLAEGSAA